MIQYVGQGSIPSPRQTKKIFFCLFWSKWFSFSFILFISIYTITAISNFFRKFAEIFSAQGAPRVIDTGGNWKESSSRKIVIIFFTPLGSRVNIYINFCLQVHLVVWSLKLFPLFATGVNNTSRTGGKICRQCRWYRWQICRWCRWYRRQFCHWCHWHRWSTLTCEYLCEFSKKIWNDPNVIFRGMGRRFMKKPEAKNPVTLSLLTPWSGSIQVLK